MDGNMAYKPKDGLNSLLSGDFLGMALPHVLLPTLSIRLLSKERRRLAGLLSAYRSIEPKRSSAFAGLGGVSPNPLP